MMMETLYKFTQELSLETCDMGHVTCWEGGATLQCEHWPRVTETEWSGVAAVMNVTCDVSHSPSHMAPSLIPVNTIN